VDPSENGKKFLTLLRISDIRIDNLSEIVGTVRHHQKFSILGKVIRRKIVGTFRYGRNVPISVMLMRRRLVGKSLHCRKLITTA